MLSHQGLSFQNGLRAQGRKGSPTPKVHLDPKPGPTPLSGNDDIGDEGFALKPLVPVGLRCRPVAARVLVTEIVSCPHRQGTALYGRPFGGYLVVPPLPRNWATG